MVTRRPVQGAEGDAAGMWAAKLLMAAEAAYLPIRTHHDPIGADVGAVVRARPLVVAGALVSLATDEQSAFWAMKAVLIRDGRPEQWADAVAKIPADAEAVDAFARTVRLYEDHAAHGAFDSLVTTPVAKLADVVEGIVLASHEPRLYLEACRKKWCTHPTRVFSAVTRKEIARTHRGLFPEEGRAAATDLSGVRRVE